jgi:hypothetical protein
MQLLRIFCITAFVLIIVSSSSSNIPLKTEDDTNTKASIIDSRSFFLSVHDKVSFSSLLQPIDAQEQEEHEVEQVEEVEETPGEEQPGEEVEETPGEEQPGEEQPGEEQPGEEQPGEEQPGEEQPGEEVEETPAAAAIDNNEKNITSFNGFRNLTNASPLEDRLSIECHPTAVEMEPGEDASINCTVENKSSDRIEIIMECSGLMGTGIECYINGEYPMGMTLTEMTDTNFSVILVSSSSPAVPAGSYRFSISVDECVNSDLC